MARRLRPQRDRITLRADSDGVAILGTDGQEMTFVRWNEVRGIEAFKRDLLTMDLICLAFHAADECFEFNEEHDGFTAVAAFMQNQFSIDSHWYSEVAQTPFAANRRTLWKRD